MKRLLLGSTVLALIGVLAIATVRTFRDSATARAAVAGDPEPAPGGVVCFGTVDLEHGVTSLLPLQPGRVVEVAVRENQAVEKGTVLLRLDDSAPRARLAEADAALALSRHQHEQARKLPDQQHDRIEQQKSVQEAMAARLAAARRILDERQKSGQPPAVAAVEVAASELEIRELEALERAEAQRLAEFKARDTDSEIRRAELELAAAQARRDQAKLALDECRIKAPRAGTVLRILVGPGDVLAAERGQPALLFAADGPQVIRATVEQEFAPRLREGESVVVQDEAEPSVSYKGRLERVAAWYSQRRTVLHDPSQMTDVRTLECVIVLEPGQPRLRLGQGVRVLIGLMSH